MRKITVHPAFDAYYYSFYVQGLIDVFGESNIQFSAGFFPTITPDFFAFFLKGKQEVRVVVDAYDGVRISDIGIDWCDVYGKVNPHTSFIPMAYTQKYVPIGPSFGVRVWPPYRAWSVALRNHLNATRVASIREHFANYSRQYRFCLPIDSYVPGNAEDRYVFFLSSIWGEEVARGTDQHRAAFIESCRTFTELTFEGGFAPPCPEEFKGRFKDYMTSKRVSFAEWLENTKRSTLVFNTPAVWSCHGWRLGQYLALGKAIISTPTLKELPAPLVHGEHVHYVDGSRDAIREAIGIILSSRDYRKHLEKNARAYYLGYLSPAVVIKRLLDHATVSVLAG